MISVVTKLPKNERSKMATVTATFPMTTHHEPASLANIALITYELLGWLVVNEFLGRLICNPYVSYVKFRFSEY